YEILNDTLANAGVPMPVNSKGHGTESEELLLRNLDCAVIQAIHAFNKANSNRAYDSVRGMFLEGNMIYPNAGFREKNHIQICIINPNCIKGYFKPMEQNRDFPIP